LKLSQALWETRITLKDSMCKSPFTLIYGNDVVMLVHLEINALKLASWILGEEDISNM
jgi:hypothetical protein